MTVEPVTPKTEKSRLGDFAELVARERAIGDVLLAIDGQNARFVELLEQVAETEHHHLMGHDHHPLARGRDAAEQAGEQIWRQLADSQRHHGSPATMLGLADRPAVAGLSPTRPLPFVPPRALKRV